MLGNLSTDAAGASLAAATQEKAPYSLMLSVDWVRIDSANTLAKFTRDIFCEIIVTPMERDKNGEPYPQQIRRTSIVKKADSTQNDFLMWYNDFQFGCDPAFKLRLHSPKFKVEIVVYHQVQGIRTQRVCAGYCKSANRDEMTVELFDIQEGDSRYHSVILYLVLLITSISDPDPGSSLILNIES